MKTKNVILGICAVVFAIGSAFTSVSKTLATDGEIDVFRTSLGDWSCEPVNQCDGSGSACVVDVQPLDEEAPVYPRFSGCQNALQNGSDEPIDFIEDSDIVDVR